MKISSEICIVKLKQQANDQNNSSQRRWDWA